LEKHLSLLRRQGLIAQWHERQVAAGTDWQQELDYHLMSASIILLLISPDFLASDYCYSRELERAMQRHAARQARVIPVLVRPVDIQGAPFARLQPLPSNGKPVTMWPNRDDAFAAIASGLRTVVEQLRQTVVATLEVSLTFLAEQERARYQELAVFPEDVTIPLATLQRLWGPPQGWTISRRNGCASACILSPCCWPLTRLHSRCACMMWCAATCRFVS
jgi:hypothetical protein